MKLLNFGKKILFSNFNILNYPYKLNFAITYKCNLKCKICSIWKKNSSNELNLKEIREFAKKNPFFSWINLTGGEPFLREDIFEIAHKFNKHNNLYILNIPTNGYMTDLILQKINKILDLGIPKVIVTVSIDGPKNIHDSIRGIKNSYSKAIETFAELNKLSKDRKNLNVFIALTLSPINIGNIKKTYQSIKRYVKIKPDDIHINLFHFSEHYYSNLGLKFKNYSKYENNLIKEIEKFKKMRNRNYTNNIKFITHSYLNFSKRFIENHKTPIRCKAINVSLFIDPFGNVFPCTIFNRKIGNIRNNNYSLKKILNYSFTKKVKEEIKKLDCPNCCSPCETNQMILSNILRHSSINF